MNYVKNSTLLVLLTICIFFLSCKKDKDLTREDFREKYLGSYNFETIFVNNGLENDTIHFIGKVEYSSLSDTTALSVRFMEKETLTVALGTNGEIQFLQKSDNTNYPDEFWGGFSDASNLYFHLKLNFQDSSVLYDVTGVKK